MSKQCTCSKNIHALKIHRARIKRPLGAEATQRTGFQPGETQEEPGPSSAAAPGPLEMDGTAGGMIKFLRPSLKSSAKDLCGRNGSDPPRKPLPLSEVGSSQPLPEEHVQES